MAIQPKMLAASGGVALLSFIGNYAVFILCYNFIAAPYLDARQREAGADFILGGAFALFAAVALVVWAAIYLASKARKPPSSPEEN